MGDEVLHSFDVVDGSRDQAAGALLGKEPVRETLNVPVRADHQVVHDRVRRYMGEAPVPVAAQSP